MGVLELVLIVLVMDGVYRQRDSISLWDHMHLQAHQPLEELDHASLSPPPCTDDRHAMDLDDGYPGGLIV